MKKNLFILPFILLLSLFVVYSQLHQEGKITIDEKTKTAVAESGSEIPLGFPQNLEITLKEGVHKIPGISTTLIEVKKNTKARMGQSGVLKVDLGNGNLHAVSGKFVSIDGKLVAFREQGSIKQMPISNAIVTGVRMGFGGAIEGKLVRTLDGITRIGRVEVESPMDFQYMPRTIQPLFTIPLDDDPSNSFVVTLKNGKISADTASEIPTIALTLSKGNTATIRHKGALFTTSFSETGELQLNHPPFGSTKSNARFRVDLTSQGQSQAKTYYVAINSGRILAGADPFSEKTLPRFKLEK